MDLRLNFFNLNLLTLLFIFLCCFSNADRVKVLTTNEDIRNTWQEEYLKMCTEASNFQPSTELNLSCKRVLNQRLFQFINVEILNEKPALLRIHKFGGDQMTKQVYKAFMSSADVENQRVEGHQYSAGHRGRIADGLWLEHHESAVQPLFKRLQTVLRINPAIAENFLILKYDVLGHYAPHYDHLFPMDRDYDDGWFEFFGNRMATALLIVETAKQGGGTVFPLLNLTIQPEKGDLLLWMNADSNDNKENLSLHAACPIEKGEKMAVSLWFRANFQDRLQSSIEDERYDAQTLIETKHDHKLRFDSRPQIHFDDYDMWPVEELDEEAYERGFYYE